VRGDRPAAPTRRPDNASDTLSLVRTAAGDVGRGGGRARGPAGAGDGRRRRRAGAGDGRRRDGLALGTAGAGTVGAGVQQARGGRGGGRLAHGPQRGCRRGTGVRGSDRPGAPTAACRARRRPQPTIERGACH
jgi:hypothetical protein